MKARRFIMRMRRSDALFFNVSGMHARMDLAGLEHSQVRILKYQIKLVTARHPCRRYQYPSDPMISVSYPSEVRVYQNGYENHGPSFSGFFIQSNLGEIRPLSTLIFQICMVQVFLGIVSVFKSVPNPMTSDDI
jgi:hypothetical protein